MISSMTGFGKGEADVAGMHFTVEVRTVNGRYGDVSVHLPRYLSELEPRVKDLMLSCFSRGRIDVGITVKGETGTQGLPKLNEAVLEAYLQGLAVLRDRGLGSGEVSVEGVAGLPNLFSFEQVEVEIETAWSALESACRTAADQCAGMRADEGAKLAEDFRSRIAALETLVADVEAIAPTRTENARKRLQEKLEALIAPDQVDPSRVLTEIAIIADRGDITEECVRFHSHNTQFLQTLERDEAVGRRLNFLLQEMLREANTIGSKASDADIAHRVVEMKEEIERLKEQVLNVE